MSVVCGFLDGTIFSVEGGYRVLQHPRPERIFDRIADARWFLAVNWCDRCDGPAAILTHNGQLSFENQATRIVGEAEFLPFAARSHIFQAGLSAKPGQFACVTVHKPDDHCSHQVKVTSLEIDPRYGPVAIVQAVAMEKLPERSPF